MIFRKILTEAPGDVTEPTPDDRSRKQKFRTMRTSDTNDYDNLPDDVKSDADHGKWAEGYRKLTNAKDIELYIDKFIAEYPPLAAIGEAKIDKIRPALKREMMSVGDKAFQPETNPILTFLQTFYSMGREFGSEDKFKTLLSMWSDGVVDDKDLKKRGPNEHIIFNTLLYDKSDVPFIVKSYEWLSNAKNIGGYIDLDSVTVDGLKDVLGPGVDVREVPKQAKDFRDLIIFKNPSNPDGSINDAAEIQKRLQALEDSHPSNKERRVEFEPVKYDKTEIPGILRKEPSTWSESERMKLASYILDLNRESIG